LLPLVVVLGAVFLYARPLTNYSETRADLAARQAAVDALQERKRELEALHARTTSSEALARQARRIGLVRPGEELFIVKGIPAWRRAQAPAAP
jgi:cell division protein FtsB